MAEDSRRRVSTQSVTVEVLAVIEGRDAINSVMTGWQDAMSQPDSLAWVRARLSGEASRGLDPPVRVQATRRRPQSSRAWSASSLYFRSRPAKVTEDLPLEGRLHRLSHRAHRAVGQRRRSETSGPQSEDGLDACSRRDRLCSRYGKPPVERGSPVGAPMHKDCPGEMVLGSPTRIPSAGLRHRVTVPMARTLSRVPLVGSLAIRSYYCNQKPQVIPSLSRVPCITLNSRATLASPAGSSSRRSDRPGRARICSKGPSPRSHSDRSSGHASSAAMAMSHQRSEGSPKPISSSPVKPPRGQGHPTRSRRSHSDDRPQRHQGP